jgi:quercetin dioxygenase-like cupin family protein
MNVSTSRWISGATGFALAATLFGVPQLRAADEARPVQAKQVFSENLPNVPGKTITGVLVKYAPGAKSPSHAHAGSVYAYVLSGQIRSENSATGPARVYQAGEGFFEPPGSTHTISENASDTEPASLLAIFVADDGVQLTRGAAEQK